MRTEEWAWLTRGFTQSISMAQSSTSKVMSSEGLVASPVKPTASKKLKRKLEDLDGDLNWCKKRKPPSPPTSQQQLELRREERSRCHASFYDSPCEELAKSRALFRVANCGVRLWRRRRIWEERTRRHIPTMARGRRGTRQEDGEERGYVRASRHLHTCTPYMECITVSMSPAEVKGQQC